MKTLGLLVICLILPMRGAICQDVTIDHAEDIITRDSLGNLLTRQQAMDLLKTGKYISVPTLNSMMQVERVIRKPNKEDGERYKTYTSRDIVISTTGLSPNKMKVRLGDTLATFAIRDKNKNSQEIESLNNKTSLLVIRHKSRFLEPNIAGQLEQLIQRHPAVNFIFCDRDQSTDSEAALFLKFKKNYSNTYSAMPHSFNEFEGYPWYILIDKNRAIKLFIPPLPDEFIALQAISKALDAN
jgi:hypothetical protein